jgi:hypothetical protein
MGTQLDLTIGDNWQPIYTTDRYALPVEGDPSGYSPIPPIKIPILFSTPYLVVRCESSTAKARWKTAGWAEQEFRLGGAGLGRSFTSFTGKREWIALRRFQLLEFPALGSDYALVFHSPWWLNHIRFEVLEYTGPISSDEADLLGTIKVDLARIEAKINSLSP